MRALIITKNCEPLPKQRRQAQVLLLASLLPVFALGQTNIRRDVLSDKVERWYRFKAADERPWFFQQIEALFNVALPSKEQLPFGISVAFLVGVSHYDYLQPQLPFVQNDLRDMREFLLTKGGFDTVYVAGDRIVNRDLIEDYMRNKFANGLNKCDRLLFYYSGHGDDSGGRTGYMQFAQVRPNNFAGPQVLAINDASDWCSEIDVDHLLFIFDCCASGLAFTSKGTSGEAYGQMIATLSRNGSRMLLTAGTAEEKTYEVHNRSGKGNGVFTRAFLNAAETGLADRSKDGFMTIEEIFAQIKDEVANFSITHKQNLTPRLWALEEAEYRGTFVFANPEAKNLQIALSDEYAKKFAALPRGEVVASYGVIRLTSYLAGNVYINGEYVGKIENGEARDYYDQKVGAHTIEIRGATEILNQPLTVAKGATTAITLRPQSVSAVESKLPETSRRAPEGMVYLPAGSFMMGSNGEKDAPEHEVYVEAFFMDRYEVTVEKFKRFIEAKNYKTDAENEGWSIIWLGGTTWEKKQGLNWRFDAAGKQFSNDEMNQPVVNVSWNDAQEYAKWAGKRLPTEAEWEYAARSGNTGVGGKPKYIYLWGNEATHELANYDGIEAKDKWQWTSPVGNFPPNSYGLYDMAGNVWEWCSSLYWPYPYSATDGRENPAVTADNSRILRGGSCGSGEGFLRCAYRNYNNPAYPTYRINLVGFRCVRDAP